MVACQNCTTLEKGYNLMSQYIKKLILCIIIPALLLGALGVGGVYAKAKASNLGLQSTSTASNDIHTKNVDLSTPYSGNPNTLNGRIPPKPGHRGINPNYICCYTGKGYDVLFIHGISGGYGGGATDCYNGNEWQPALDFLFNHQWMPNALTYMIGYYSGDTNCDVQLNDPTYNPENNPPGGGETYTDRPRCNGFPNGYQNTDPSNGTNNEPLEHIACELAWYIWDNYAQHGYSLDLVAHSMGGDIVKYMLYKEDQQSTNYDSHFPAYLFVNQIVTFSSPLAGIPVFGSLQCGGCQELAELQFGSTLDSELQGSQGINAQGLNGTQWTTIGTGVQGCDVVPAWSAVDMNGGTKILYIGVPGLDPNNNLTCFVGGSGVDQYDYTHGGYLIDIQSSANVHIQYCFNCGATTSFSYYGTSYSYTHSIQTMYDALIGNCSAAPSTSNCDGDDPFETGCYNSSYLQSGEPWYMKVYWSTGCQSNWAWVYAPKSGVYIKTVTIARSAPGPNHEYTASWCNASNANSRTCWDSGDVHLEYCSAEWTLCPKYIWAWIGDNTTNWYTDLLYAPNQAVDVYVTFSNGTDYSSHWH